MSLLVRDQNRTGGAFTDRIKVYLRQPQLGEPLCVHPDNEMHALMGYFTHRGLEYLVIPEQWGYVHPHEVRPVRVMTWMDGPGTVNLGLIETNCSPDASAWNQGLFGMLEFIRLSSGWASVHQKNNHLQWQWETDRPIRVTWPKCTLATLIDHAFKDRWVNSSDHHMTETAA